MTEAKVREQYDQVASQYDWRWRSYTAQTLDFLQACAKISSSANVLDVGCGTGEFEQRLVKEHPDQHVVGVDLSENMLEIAQKKFSSHSNVQFQHASVLALPFPKQTFDVVVSANAFHYFDQPLAALAEVKRVLKPQGQLIILDWCRDFLLCKVCDAVLKIFDSAHQQCYTQAEFHQLLASAQFEISQTTKDRFGLIWGLMAAVATPKQL
ncbi:Demethylmenaquinone methyltransferase [Acaryochloris thomasi RCC1774]|uniref:Demethylmenaquinone methyltransferase n=1 Tax=Acaryochloris thomasi RCC1774 TaxID=1764569 RepID=A0A2W1JA22_9CYAN|nr:class I SAM-dependent methyltransferase [Acaryochloris thomasi]PZD71020.1 Demethylmenaquinone methyltransferase [Acaryochloris thomasi RCC1774]